MAFGFGFGMPRIFSASRAFSPASFFANGEQGWWYDPSNFATLFQDSAGTTPVTAVEQPVGLQLDLSKGLVLGPTLVTNGDFSDGTTTGWTAGASTLSVVSGAMRVTNIAVNFGNSQQIDVTEIGKTYRLTFTVGSQTGTSSAWIGTSPGGTQYRDFDNISSGSYALTFTATSTTLSLRFLNRQTTIGNFSDFDNISVKELPGNHRFQSTSANRPVVSARVNLLTKTEDFSDAVWVKTGLNAFGSGSVANTTATTDPLGGNTADFIQENSANSQHEVYVNKTETTGPLLNYTYSVRVKSAGRTAFNVSITGFTGNNYVAVLFDLSSTGSVALVTQIGTTTHISSSISPAGNGWFVCTVTVNSPDIRYIFNGMSNTLSPTYDSLGRPSYTGNGTSGIYIWGADLRVTNQGVNLPAYQRVNTSTDYDSTGFPTYIKPNGSNQFMQTNSINFTATDKMTVWQGVRKLSDAAAAILMELSTVAPANNGSFYVAAPDSSATYGFGLRGTASINRNASTYTAPITNVFSTSYDIAQAAPATELTIRINAATPGTIVNGGAADAGTGNFGTWPAYFYMRAGTSLPFNGNDYGSIARGAASTAAQITNGEAYMAAKTGVTLLVETFDFITTDAGDQIVTDAGDSVTTDIYYV
jgi:hypothetical protein